VNNLYQGMTLDPVTGLYYARNRNYSPTLGRWINQDPAGYINGANTYQFVMSNPVGKTDPEGLCNCDQLDKQLLQNEAQQQKLFPLIDTSRVVLGMEKEGLDKKVQQWQIDEQRQALADMESNLQNLRKAEKQIYQQIEQSGCPLPELGYSYSPPPYAFPGTGGGPGPGHDSTELILQILEIIVGAF
jgi:RHS repeat-associated protein